MLTWELGKRWSLWLAAALATVALLLHLRDATRSPEQVLRQAEQRVQAAFHNDILRYDTLSSMAAVPAMSAQGIPPVVLLKLSKNATVLAWSHQQFIPSLGTLQAQLANMQPEVLVEKNQVFYNLKLQRDSIVYFRLIPLRITYPIRNEYLSDYLYLGPIGANPRMSELVDGRNFSLLQNVSGMHVNNPAGEHIFSIRITDVEPLRAYNKLAVLLLMSMAVLVLLWPLRQALRHTVHQVWLRELLFVGLLAVLRLVLLAFNYPTAYVSTELFSAQLLALNAWAPSLGDLTLNSILLIVVAYRMYRVSPAGALAGLLHRWGRWAWYGYHVVWVGLALVIYVQFMALFELLALNSKTYFDFSDILRLNVYSLILFLDIGLALLAIFVLQYLLSSVSLAHIDHTARRSRWVFFGFGLAAMVVGLYQESMLEAVAFCAIAIGPYWLRQQNDETLSFSLVHSLLLVALLAGVTNLGIARSLRINTKTSLDYYTQRYANSQEEITRFLFDEVAENIKADKTLWGLDSVAAQPDTIGQDLLARIVNNHLANNFRGYDFQVFIFDSRGQRMDTQFDMMHYAQLASTERRVAAGLQSELAYVPFGRNSARYIYIGRFPVSSPVYGKMVLQIEFHPKATTSSRLYPQLLMDQRLRQKLTLPPDYSVGIYQNKFLQQHEGDYSFAAQLTQAMPQGRVLHETDTHYEYYNALPEDRVVYIRAPKRSFFDQITAFSFLCYFYLLLFILKRVPSWLAQVRQRQWGFFQGSFAFRVQFFMGLIGFLPLLILWLLSSPLFQRLYTDDAKQGLKNNLQQVSDYMEADAVYMHDINSYNYPLSTSLMLIHRVGNLISSDVNVYTRDGRLFNTNRPKIYQTALASPYMHPEALRQLQQANNAELIITEQIGRLHYFSGYVPLFDHNNALRGYLNLPYLSQQDLFEGQLRRFAAYLINMYMILLLGIIVGGIVISKTLTNPLRLLQQKLERTSLGYRNEPLEWHSRDEIGAIIRSYNDMLRKLEESEQQLTKSQRELAWREMARQIAHEIKNPLTPMKLGIQQLLRSLGQAQPSADAEQQVVERISHTLLTEIDTLSNIAGSFSQFANMPQVQLMPMAMNEVLTHVYNLYQGSEEAEVHMYLPRETLQVNADRDQLNRIFVNLVRNALQAMNGQQGLVVLRLYTERGLVVVSVSDNGVGIPEAVQHRIFEPNFSTKTSGMGLGLAITRRLVESMEGSIHFTSAPEQGTTFYVSFPAVNAHAAA